MRHLLPVAAACLALVACSDTPTTSATLPLPATSPAAQGDLSASRLRAMLLQAEDLPDQPSRRPSASADLTTQATPQLALCRPPAEDAPHQSANVLAQSGKVGQANVFEVLSAYADETAARAAYDRARDAAQQCTSYDLQGETYQVEDLAAIEVPGSAAGFHYRITTPDVVSGDVRTLVRSGRYTVLISGYGAAPGGAPLLDFQAAVAGKALARLG